MLQRLLANALIAALLASVALSSHARIHRSHQAIAEFKRQQPCPANGRTRGPCPGWIIDHITPLCAGGSDTPANMQWQTKPDSLIKDREEWRYCRTLKNKS